MFLRGIASLGSLEMQNARLTSHLIGICILTLPKWFICTLKIEKHSSNIHELLGWRLWYQLTSNVLKVNNIISRIITKKRISMYITSKSAQDSENLTQKINKLRKKEAGKEKKKTYKANKKHSWKKKTKQNTVELKHNSNSNKCQWPKLTS